MIKTKAEINEIKNRKTEKMKETKAFYLRRLITDTSLTILTKEKTIQDTNCQYQERNYSKQYLLENIRRGNTFQFIL